MTRIFVYSAGLPKFDIQAGDRRFAELLRLLAQFHQVDLCLREDEADPSNPSVAAWTEKYRRHLIDGGVRLLPAGWRHIEWALLRGTYDIGLFEFYTNAADILPLFRRLQPQARILIDSVDLHYVREQAAADLGLLTQNKADQTRRRELDVYRRSDMVIAVSEWDRAVLEAEGGLPPTAIVPIIVPNRLRQDIHRGKELLFVGGFDHLPNLDGLKWFVDGAWPKIRDAIPDANLTVIGSNPKPEVFAMADLLGISVLGFVPDTNPYLDRAAVSIAPLRYGAGMKGKVTEALASGVPVVTTTIGVQGLQVASGKQLLLSDDPDGFAEAVVSLLRNPVWAREVGLEGQRYVARLCAPDVVARMAEEALSAAQFGIPGTRSTESRMWNRLRFEAFRLLCLPYWFPEHLFRRHLKSRFRTLRDRIVQRHIGRQSPISKTSSSQCHVANFPDRTDARP